MGTVTHKKFFLSSLQIAEDNGQQDRKGEETKRGPRLINCASFAIGQRAFALFSEESSCFSNSSPLFLRQGTDLALWDVK